MRCLSWRTESQSEHNHHSFSHHLEKYLFSLRPIALSSRRTCVLLVLIRVTVEEDTKIPNAATLTINKEDHTLANMLRSYVPLFLVRSPSLPSQLADPDSSITRSQLLLMPYVLFAGYKVPHPLESRVVLKLQTDGSQTAIQAVQNAIQELIVLLGKAKNSFSQELIKSRALDGAEDQFGGAGEGFY